MHLPSRFLFDDYEKKGYNYRKYPGGFLMKNYTKILGYIALTAIIAFSTAACGGDDDGGGEGSTSLAGDWYSSRWKETFTFDLNDDGKTGDFEKMADGGWGERGTFSYTKGTFTTIITHVKDDKTKWEWGAPDKENLEESRKYVISGNTLVLNGEHQYVFLPPPDGAEFEGSWYSSEWKETFTFHVAAGTFEKMHDDGYGEKGPFTFTAKQFTTTITHILDEKTDWEWFTFQEWEAAGGVRTEPLTETRGFAITGDKLILNGEHEYTKR
jgi:hypothetical protein